MTKRLMAVTVAVLVGSAVALSAQQPTFSARRESVRVDVLVTDQRMPEMTGIELVATARSEGFDVTALLLTGYTDPEDIIAAIKGS